MVFKKIINSVTVLIPAYNEEKSLRKTVSGAIKVLDKEKIDYEIIVIDDGSTDGTGEVADSLKKNSRIRILHHKKNLGFGRTIKDGIEISRMGYITGLPGDNDTSPKLLTDLINRKDEADLIIAYMDNTQSRNVVRRILSFLFVLVMNMTFGLKLRYYNSYFICRRKLLSSIVLRSKSFSIFAEAKVKLIKNGATYKEIPFQHIVRKYGRSKAVGIKSLINIIEMYLGLIKDVNLGKS